MSPVVLMIFSVLTFDELVAGVGAAADVLLGGALAAAETVLAHLDIIVNKIIFLN